MADCYPIKARTRDGDWYVFTELDVPCFINNNEYILLRKPNSPILQAGLIMRGCDIPDIFEGDRILADGVEYTVIYHCGFICRDAEKNTRYLYEFDSYKKLGNVIDEEDCTYVFPKKMYYKFRDFQIFPRAIKGATADKVIIDNLGATYHFEEVRQEARISYERKKLYFGDLVSGYPLVLYYGRPVIKHDDIIFDVVTKKEIAHRKETV